MNWLIDKKSQLSLENNPIQIDNQTGLDLRDRVMGMLQTFQHKNSPNVPIQNAKNTS
jgi:hypothetical protein